MVGLQKLEKALVHSGDVTMNICVSLRWKRGDCIQVMVYLGVMCLKWQGALLWA